SGQLRTVADLKGKITLINIWATWCVPCREELPAVQKQYEQLKDSKDLQVITIATDDNPGLVRPFMDNQHYTFPVVLAHDFAEQQGFSSIPRTWIVDAAGTLRAERIGYYPGDWPDAMLAKLKEIK